MRTVISNIAGFCLLTCFLCTCEAQPPQEIFNVLAQKDHKIPVFLGSEAIALDTVVYRFDETVFCQKEDFNVVDGYHTIVSIVPMENTVSITFDKALEAGKRITVTGQVADSGGNTLWFSAGCWGRNDRIPMLLINEFTTKGSKNNPDQVELLALSAGNLAGITLYDGIGPFFDSECILSTCDVAQGDYIVITYGEEIPPASELEFYGGPTGLGANNGVLTLCEFPEGPIIDAVLYSNRTSSSDSTYGGFGTKKVQERAALLAESGHWLPNDPLIPEAGIDSTSSTATRSMCRDPDPIDTNSRADWHIVPTGKASFGAQNTAQRY